MITHQYVAGLSTQLKLSHDKNIEVKATAYTPQHAARVHAWEAVQETTGIYALKIYWFKDSGELEQYLTTTKFSRAIINTAQP